MVKDVRLGPPRVSRGAQARYFSQMAKRAEVGTTPLASATNGVAQGVGRPADYVERNRAAWDEWAPRYAPQGREAWQHDELRWGLWNTPESKLQLLSETALGGDAVELGCGSAAICAWLKRAGIHPVGVDVSHAQLDAAAQLQHEFGLSFPLVCANAEAVPFDNDCFDVAISEYGASLWCDPTRWLREAHRLLRPDGQLLFITNGAFLMACTPQDGGAATDILVRSYFSGYRVEFPEDATVEFHLTHGHWVRLLRASGFVLENLIEVRPPRGAKPRFPFVSTQWARRWPSEEIWIARKVA
jgi:SAM-dependent methyltransferase